MQTELTGTAFFILFILFVRLICLIFFILLFFGLLLLFLFLRLYFSFLLYFVFDFFLFFKLFFRLDNIGFFDFNFGWPSATAFGVYRDISHRHHRALRDLTNIHPCVITSIDCKGQYQLIAGCDTRQNKYI